ncbi:mitochondrial carrier domain-containing protein [Gymnopilus junonius]|uniref:Mitochondrial carrier domain-containing protein n=1 Tax=Gymnopilus junonius TaxID=109634 RepID=A0A9P5NC19_GYMJU|nr:mitochondrial carrier domain-containing protein [Gymnopilus junonius]
MTSTATATSSQATAAAASLSTKTATTTTIAQTGVAPVAKKALFGFLTPEIASYFVAGGCAGAASRTVVSPLERLKIIQQVQPQGTDSQYKGVWRSLVRMYNEEGFKGFMRGNGINCLRIVPYSAVQFTTYEQLKKVRVSMIGKCFTARVDVEALLGLPYAICLCLRLREHATRPPHSCANMAGGTNKWMLAIVTVPLHAVMMLDYLPSISFTAPAAPKVASAPSTLASAPALSSAYHTSSAVASNATSVVSAAGAAASSVYSKADLTMWGMTLKIVREEGGVRALYRGLITTAVGVAPYVGINFAAYEFLRGVVTPPGKSSVPRKLLCGALAGSISQTLTYPFDVLRRKMQVTGMQNGSIKYNGAIDALTSIVRVEGVRGLYRGLWPNLLKVAPSIATSFFTYELVKEFLIPP